MPKYKLEELCEFITDGTHQTPEYCAEGGIIFLSSKDVTGRIINWDDVKHIPYSLHEQLNKRLSPQKNDILLAKNGTTGVAAIVDRDIVFDVYVSLAVLRPLKTIYPKYLLYAINSPVANRQFNAGLKGVGVPNLHLSVIRKTVINVVPRKDQEKICDILDSVITIIQKRKQELAMLDVLIKARFIELFGDPVYVDKDASLSRLGDICNLKAGKFVKASDISEKSSANNYPCYGGNGIRGYVSSYSHEGDFPLIGRQGALCGNVQYATGKFHATEHAVVVTPIIEVDRYWLYSLLFELKLNRYASGAAQPGLAVNKLEQIRVKIPTLDMQKRFSCMAQQINKSKFAIQQSLDETQILFDSLMQKYFG